MRWGEKGKEQLELVLELQKASSDSLSDIIIFKTINRYTKEENSQSTNLPTHCPLRVCPELTKQT